MNPDLAYIDVVVSDMDASLAFYSRLGLKFQVDPAFPGHAGCDMANGVHLMLDAEEFMTPFLPGWTRGEGGRRTMLCFGFPTPADVDAKYGELAEAGYRGMAKPFDAPWGMRYATVLDPDGNGVNLYAPLNPATG
ncbi:VOC family protein [Thermoactinospora rubra]|uniref:VOC family protein n=1 Tax=Thermoactinospora rubra TaxID=1088767 RepID=UPI000A1065E2|nr:VOC family protein [Thermoactinospora rubra]